MENQPTTLLEKLQDNNYALYFAIVTCMALAPNSYYMFHAFSIIPEEFFSREIQAAVVALIISGSILYYTAKKNLEYANKFAYFEFFISCCYYFQSLIMTDKVTHLEADPHWNWHIIPAVAFAYMLPWSVKGYAASIDYDQIKKRVVEAVAPVLPIVIEPVIEEKKEPEPIILHQASTEELLNIISNENETEKTPNIDEKDDLEDVFGKGSIGTK